MSKEKRKKEKKTPPHERMKEKHHMSIKVKNPHVRDDRRDLKFSVEAKFV